MTDDAPQTLHALRDQVVTARLAFERDVAQAAMAAIVTGVSVAPAIGDVSVLEAKEAVVREFRKALGLR